MNLRHAPHPWLLTIALTAVLITPTTEFLGRENLLIKSASESDLLEDVSEARLHETVSALASFGTRAFYTNSSHNSSIYIHDKLSELGLWVYYQNLEVYGFQVRNVVAVKNGSDPAAPQYLFGAHYDSVNRDVKDYSEGETTAAPGADDDASGVAAVLEIATVLRDSAFENTVKFVAFTAEETGLNGSAYFVQQEEFAGVVYANTAIMDMIGFRAETENRAMVFGGAVANTLAASIVSAVDKHGLSLSVDSVPGYSMVYSDHASFWSAGYPSLLVIEQLVDLAPVYPYYHTSNDTPDRLSFEQMTAITKAILGGFLILESPLKIDSESLGLLVIGVSAIALVVVVIVYLAMRKKVL